MPTPVLEQIEKNGITYNLQDAQAQADIAVIKPALAKKANVDGYYQDAGVGTAEQLIASVYAEDQVPYVFRPSGGSGDVGTRMFDEMVGGSLNWNQLMQYRNTYTASGITIEPDGDTRTYVHGQNTDGTRIWPQLTKNAYITSGHVYLVTARIDGTLGGYQNLYVKYLNSNDADAQMPIINGFGSCISKPISTGNIAYVYKIMEADESIDAKISFVFTDLTALLGATIADYILTLNEATPGAGVARLKSWGLFTKDYYPFKAVTMEHMQVSAHETVEFNQWDEQWEYNGISVTDGQNINVASTIRSKNYNRCVGNATYSLTCPTNDNYVFWYDADKNYISNKYLSTVRTCISPANACYFRLRIGSYDHAYKNDICINFHKDGSRDGEYEPYKKHTYTLDPVVLRGIPKKDENGNLYFDGDIYKSDGTVTRRFGVVDLGTLTWQAHAETSYVYIASPANMAIPTTTAERLLGIMCDHYLPDTIVAVSEEMGDKTMKRVSGKIMIRDMSYSTVEAFKAAVSGFYLLYELATPTTEQADPFTDPQIVSNWGTERYVDAAYEDGDRDFEFPAGHYTQYMQNLRDKLQHLPNLAEADGTYAVSQTGRQMGLVSFGAAVDESAPVTALKGKVPDCPVTNDGKYVLTATVASGDVSYAWEVMA